MIQTAGLGVGVLALTGLWVDYSIGLLVAIYVVSWEGHVGR